MFFYRGFDDVVARGQVAGGVEREEESELVAEGAEGGGLGVAVAEPGEKMSSERVVEDVEHERGG